MAYTICSPFFGTSLKEGRNNGFLNEFLREAIPLNKPVALQAIDVWEDEQRYVLELDCPGWEMNELEVSVLENVLTVSGTPREVPVDESKKVLRKEREKAAFRRALKLRDPLNLEGIDAQLKHGVLTVSVPKAPQATPIKIQLRSE